MTKDEARSHCRGLMVRYNWSLEQLAEYFGLPVTTVKNWYMGVRQPTASALRVISILAMLEATAPDIHKLFLPRLGDES